jgi:hypothetical protein
MDGLPVGGPSANSRCSGCREIRRRVSFTTFQHMFLRSGTIRLRRTTRIINRAYPSADLTYLLAHGIHTSLSPRGILKFLARGTVVAGNSHQTRASQAGIRSQKVTRQELRGGCREDRSNHNQNHMIPNFTFCPGPGPRFAVLSGLGSLSCPLSLMSTNVRSRKATTVASVPLPMLVRRETSTDSTGKKIRQHWHRPDQVHFHPS